MLCNVLEKYYSWPGFSLRLGSILQYRNSKSPLSLCPGILASSYLVRQSGEEQLLDVIYSRRGYILGISDVFINYFAELLENPGRSGTAGFDQHRYMTAAKECLQLCLCSHHSFSMGAMESTLRDKTLRRYKPFAWRTRLGFHSRIQKGLNYVQVKLFNRWSIQDPSSLPKNSLQFEFYLYLSYQWALDLFPFLLAKSATSLELAKALHCPTFAMMAQRFPRRMRLVKEAIGRYLLRVEPVEGNP